eukprot:401642_1
MALFTLLYMCIPTAITALIPSTITNTTAEYYITSQSGSFATDTIICQSTSCIIICNNPQNCSSTNINASLSNTLTLYCTKYKSCYEIKITKGPSTSIQINCQDTQACDNAIFNIAETVNIDIKCSNVNCAGTCGTTDGSCRLATFNAEFATNVNINCLDRFDCYQSQFNVNHTSITNVYSEYYGLYKATFIATYMSTEINLNCTVKQACRTADIYCPINAPCNLYCNNDAVIYACRDMDIWISNNNYPQLHLDCGANADNCQGIDIQCMDTGLRTNYVWIKSGNHGCTEMDACCPPNLQSPINIIECTADTNCVVNCTDTSINCSYKTIINGSKALSLSVVCQEPYECTRNDIQCPNNGDCILSCMKDHSCNFIKFIAETIRSLSVYCFGDYSCASVDIIGLFVNNNVNIYCTGKWGCQYMNIFIELKKDF